MVSFITSINEFVLEVRFDYISPTSVKNCFDKVFIMLYEYILIYESQLFLNKPGMVEKLIVPL